MLRILPRIALVLILTSAASARVTIPTVTVGSPGNAADSTGFGAVAYWYAIGVYEVTAGQYAEFLNAVASSDDNSLYNANMSNASFGCGITRTGLIGAFFYSVDPAFVNRPVTFVSFWDAARFANWLHNGQPSGPQDNSTTEDGAYTLTPGGITANTITRNAGWRWAVTTENEWYKAAYYKGNGTNAGYWTYPTGSNTVPGTNSADPSGNNANYFLPQTFPIDFPYYTTLVGEFQNSASPQGTFDQGGNVWEWNESIFFGSNRGIRGGSWFNNDGGLRADISSFSGPTGEFDTFGFRVSQPLPPPLPVCPGDANGDQQIDGADLSVLLAQFGTSVTPGTGADFNGDGVVNGADLSVLLANFGGSCP